jgi:hypothetical protein
LNFIQKLKNSFSSAKPVPIEPFTDFIYPYSTEAETKRQQVWENLQKGILFEDVQVFIPWLTPYSDVDRYAVKRRNSGDRTNWFLGEHKIMDGVHSFVGVMKWITVGWKKPVSKIEEFLGVDGEGNQKFLGLIEHLTNLLGVPGVHDLEKFGEFDLGVVQWTNGNVTVSLVGIEQFECKYRLHIGLTDTQTN